MIGLAGALLVFTGIWHALEWAMGGRNRDTARLIPFGIAYLLLGYLIVTLQFMPLIAWVALAVTLLGGLKAYTSRETSMVRPWVTWVFINVDAVIVLALLVGLLR